MTAKSAVETQGNIVTDIAVHNRRLLTPAQRAWEDVDSIDSVFSADIEKDKMELCGVPFIITGATFRPGRFKNLGQTKSGEFVSVELITAPEPLFTQLVNKYRSRLMAQGFNLSIPPEIGPDESLIINDSSTGIRRQLVQYLHLSGMITVKEGAETSDLTGQSGTNVFDTESSDWVSGGAIAATGISLRLLCKRGLRPSQYENEYTPEGMTFYLA